MHVLNILFLIVVVLWTTLRTVMHINESLRRGRGCILIVFPITCLALVAFFYFLIWFPRSKGPDDAGALSHASRFLAAQYGPDRGAYFALNRFEQDNPQSGSGTYRIRFRYEGHHGVILCHYDKPDRKFDSDQIVPDP